MTGNEETAHAARSRRSGRGRGLALATGRGLFAEGLMEVRHRKLCDREQKTSPCPAVAVFSGMTGWGSREGHRAEGTETIHRGPGQRSEDDAPPWPG